MKPEDGYILYIVNPKSGSHTANRIVWGFRDYLQFRKFRVNLVFTKSLTHATELAEAAVKDDDCAMVVTAGGDGTVRDVVNGMAGSDKPLLPLPGGTENLLASELGYDERLATVINAFEDNFTRPLDICKADGRYFTCIAGFGFDAEVVKELARKREGNIDQSAYFWPCWRTYWAYRYPPISVEIDGEKVFDGRGIVFVGNISRYAMGLHILKNADYSDGLLDVCIYPCSSHTGFAKSSLLTVLKLHTRIGSVIYRQCKSVRISSDADIATQIDGDPGPKLPVEISIMPRAVNLIVPRGAKPAGLRTRLIRMFQ